MANVAPTITAVGGGAVLIKWGPFNAADTIQGAAVGRYSDKTVHMISGTYTTGRLMGSNDQGGAGAKPLTDADNVGGPAVIDGTLLSVTSSGRLAVIRENPLVIFPEPASATNAVIAVLCR